MHELSIAGNILEIVREHLPEGRAEVASVKVRIGEMSGVVPDSLAFCFEALTAGTPLQGARLQIQEIPLSGRCRACGYAGRLADGALTCSACGSGDLELIAGRELEVVEIELNDEGER
jgi:hydrogenase nickel incorporation protein HypA/HybF